MASEIIVQANKGHDISAAQERLKVVAGILGMTGVMYGRR